MRYISTRGEAPEVGFTEALLGGLAPDGGLYAPADWPVLTPAEIGAFAGAPYAAVAAHILARFVGDEMPRADLERLCARPTPRSIMRPSPRWSSSRQAGFCSSSSTARPWPSRTWPCRFWPGFMSMCSPPAAAP